MLLTFDTKGIDKHELTLHNCAPFMVFIGTCAIESLTPFWGICYTNNWQLHHHSYLMALGVQLHWFEYLGTNIICNVMRCMPMLHNGLQVERLYKNETCDQIWHLTNYKQNKVYILYWSFCNKLDELEALKWDKIIVLYHSLSLSLSIYIYIYISHGCDQNMHSCTTRSIATNYL